VGPGIEAFDGLARDAACGGGGVVDAESGFDLGEVFELVVVLFVGEEGVGVDIVRAVGAFDFVAEVVVVVA